MPTIHNVENFIFWLTAEGKLLELLTAEPDGVPVISESLDEYGFPYYNYSFIRANQQASEGNIKGGPIPNIQLLNGRIQKQDEEAVKAFVQTLGVNQQIAARVLLELEEPKTICLCSPSLLDGTASTVAVTFNKNRHGDTIMWVRDDVDAEPDSLTKVEFSDVRTHLPLAAELEVILQGRSIGHIAFDRKTQTWRS